MSNHALPHGVERRRQIWRFEAPESAEKNFLAKIACNPLISLVSDERIQGNPTFISRGFRRETGRGQEKPNGPPGQRCASPTGLFVGQHSQSRGALDFACSAVCASLRRCGVLPLRRAIGIGNLVGVAGDEIVCVVDLSRGLERLVHVSRAVLVGEHPAQD